MGIHNLMYFLRRKCPSSLTNIPVKIFRGQTIGIDTSVLLYKYASIYKDEWLMGFVNVIDMFQRNNITPIFVMDGEPYPEKKITLERRKERAKISAFRTKELTKAYDKYKRNGEIEYDVLEKFLTEHGSLGGSPTLDTERLEERLNVKLITEEDKRLLKNFFQITQHTIFCFSKRKRSVVVRAL